MLDNKIKEALKGLEDKSILTAVEAINDKAEAKDKVQEANEDLVNQRKDWESKEKEYKSTIASSESAISDKDSKIKSLEEGKLTAEELKDLKSVEKYKADFNQLSEKLVGIEEKLTASEKKAEDAEEKSKKSKKEAKEQALKTAVSNALAAHKITDAKNDTAMDTLFARGYAGLEENEDGTLKEMFYTFNDKHEKVTSDLGKMVSSFAEKNKFLVSSSGNGGPGQNHDRYIGSQNNDFKTLRDAKVAEKAGWDQFQ